MKTMLEIRIDRTKTLAEEPSTGHNGWHPDIPPIIRCAARGRRGGVDQSEDVSLAARNALLNMIDYLDERGWTPQQAYAICSVAGRPRDQPTRRCAKHAGLGAPTRGCFRPQLMGRRRHREN